MGAVSGRALDLEFKIELPQQVSKLADEVAAFATSNDGLVLLGVDDRGATVGLAGAHDVQVRDKLATRVNGLVVGIAPPVRATLQWATCEGRVVLGFKVRKGGQPHYYSGGRPMIRDHSSSRGARPDEVIEAVSAFVAAGRPEMDAEERAESEFVASTASAIADLIGWCDTPGLMLDLNPWCELWQSIAAAGAGDLRDIAAESLAIERDHAAHLQAAADALGAVAGFRHTFGAGPAFPDVTAVARQRLVDSFARVVGSTPLDAGSVEGLADAAEKACRKLKDAWARAEAEPFLGQVERTIEESSRVGRRFLRFSYFRFAAGQAVGEPLRVACLALIGLGEQRMYVDGGASQAAAIEAGRASVEALRIAARALRKSLRA